MAKGVLWQMRLRPRWASKTIDDGRVQIDQGYNELESRICLARSCAVFAKKMDISAEKRAVS